MPASPQTLRFTHRHLPHWEVDQGRYFITVRCADSLPQHAIFRLQELNQTLVSLPPQAPAFFQQQRLIFRTLEKFLDAGMGSCPLRQPVAADIVVDELRRLGEWGCAVPHFTVMPNHWHALMIPAKTNEHSISQIMKRLKGRTARQVNAALGTSGPVWQREWFDRWMRSEAEWEKSVDYIHTNPVRAGLVPRWEDHAWTR